MPGRRHPRAVELDELGGDLLDVPFGAGLGGLPVRAAEFVEGRLLATDVARHLVQLVGGDEEAVAGVTTLGRAYSMTRYSRVAPCTVRCIISTNLPTPCLLVHDVVTGAELERVDLVAALGGHPPHVAVEPPVTDACP